jgi:serine/threonine protein kinase
MFQAGEILGGKYRVEGALGQGGMGYVLSAMHLQLQQRVAIKLLMPELCENEEAVERFLREARAAVRIQSEHVARVIDVGKLDSGEAYMVMEFLSGRDLARELDERKQLAVEEAVDFVLQACEAVAEAHTLGVIHRDLKPANLFLTQRNDGAPLVKVLDFGVAKAIAMDNGTLALPSLTATQSVVGSPLYMSPEQVRRPRAVDFRTDLWSLGVILYELLVGAPPFEGDTALSMLAAIVSDPTPSVREKRPDLPVGLEAVISKCLQKKPEDRYQNVGELAQALASYAPDSSRASILRISRVMRSFAYSSPPGGLETLPTVMADTERIPSHPIDSEATVRPLGEPVSGASDAKDTRTGWGRSRQTAFRPRPGLALAIAAGGVLGLVVLLWITQPWSGPRVQSRAELVPAAAPPRPPTIEMPAAPATIEPAAPTTMPSVAETEEHTQAPAVASSKTRTEPKRAPAPAQPASRPATTPARTPRTEPLDPLEGRR